MSNHIPAGTSLPTQYRPVGIALAVGSGLFIGSSFVIKKKGLIASGGGHEGVAYLRNPIWWTGMTMMIVGEIMNFGAYAFVEAIVVTPLGALSVVVCAIMSSWFLNEKLTTLGWLACAECIFGSTIIALNAPKQPAVATIHDFKEIFLAPWFLAWGSVCLASAFALIFIVAPRYGEKTMLVYITICSLFGGLSVSCIQGLGMSILTTIRGQNQFKNWFIYFLLAFVISTLLSEIFFLNKALAMFNTAMVTPTYYVIFTFCVIVTSAILYQGFKASAATIITLVLAFLTICAGITLLQLSKVDPKKLKVDPNTSLLLAANQAEIENPENQDPEKVLENPGIDAIRAFGTIGTITRARRHTIYDEHGNVVRPGTIYSRGSNHTNSQNGFPPNSRGNSPVELRRRLPSNNAVTPNSTTSPSRPTFPVLSPPSIKETDEEPTMSSLLRKDEMQASPEPISPNPSFLGVKLRRPGASREQLRSFKKSGPTTPSSHVSQPEPEMKEKEVAQDKVETVKDKDDPTKQEKEEEPSSDGKDEGDATIRLPKPTP